MSEVYAQSPLLPTEPTKQCRDCGRELPHSAFYFNKRDGIPLPRCKECHNRYSLARYHGKRDGTWQPQEKPPIPTEKQCTRCGEVKPLDSFHRASEMRDGHRTMCKDCTNVAATEYRQTHPDEQRATYARYRRTHPGRRQEIARRYDRRNPGMRAVIAARWRAQQHDATVNDFTYEQWQVTLAYFNHACAYCGATGVPLEQEHMLPLSRGGDHTAANIVPACRTCNAGKGDKNLAEYLALA